LLFGKTYLLRFNPNHYQGQMSPLNGGYGAGGRSGGKSVDVDWRQHIIEERFAATNGGAFREFDRMYRGQAGKDGGWETTADKHKLQ
jgi:hypothetical protein